MSYCTRHGHERSKNLGDLCINCGAALAPEIPLGEMVEEAFEEALPSEPLNAVEAMLARTAVPADTTKPTNPKDAIGSKKLPMHLVPSAVTRYAALSFFEGASKYGKYNWRVAGVRMSIYLDAIARHYSKLLDGEWQDAETQVPHLASIIASCGIILDAHECGKLNDDRPPINVATSPAIDLSVAHLDHIRAMFASFTPHQNVITDAPE